MCEHESVFKYTKSKFVVCLRACGRACFFFFTASISVFLCDLRCVCAPDLQDIMRGHRSSDIEELLRQSHSELLWIQRQLSIIAARNSHHLQVQGKVRFHPRELTFGLLTLLDLLLPFQYNPNCMHILVKGPSVHILYYKSIVNVSRRGQHSSLKTPMTLW